MTKVLWILTIGSSDVQLESRATTEGKKKSPENAKRSGTPQVWRCWYSTQFQASLRSEYNNLTFEPAPISREKEASYRIEARLLGMLYQYYQEHDTTIQDELWSYLTFPLLDGFIVELDNDEKKPRPQPDSIALILTDQATIFDTKKKCNEKSPYWQDTCTLLPILERYFQDKYPNAEILKFQENSDSKLQPITLSPDDSTKGLDNWNSVLGLVRTKFKQLPNQGETREAPEPECVYVSHQAGTPAISSAVQFSSLAMYGDRVQFLVSNERDLDNTQFIKSSSYLQGLRREEAKELLKGYDYAGVNKLIGDYLGETDQIKLKSAKIWNISKFEKFVEELQELPDEDDLKTVVKERSQTWWWIAYEEIYLAIIRQRQKNTVEAFFHSFRAFEGIFAEWGNHEFGRHIEPIGKISYLNYSILDDPKNYFSCLTGKTKKSLKNIHKKLEILKEKSKAKEEIKKDDRIELNFRTLCYLFKGFNYSSYSNNCKDLNILWSENNVSEKRNFIFHQVQGMEETDLWTFWGVNSCEEWESRLYEFINFISTVDHPQSFKSMKEESLMVRVHRELEEAIASL